MQKKATRIITKTCESFFTIQFSREATAIKCEKSFKKLGFIVIAHFSCKTNLFVKGFDIRQELINLQLITKNTKVSSPHRRQRIGLISEEHLSRNFCSSAHMRILAKEGP